MNLYDGNLTLLGSIAFMAGGALIFGVAALVAVGAILGLRREPVPARFGAMLARHGLDWGRIAAAGGLRDLALGLNRCAECRAAARCSEWLDCGAREGYQSFCPNAAFVERMKVVAQR
jgi:hypothetical protein